ncbi:MAG: MMPL family transporter [Deltaproteobacteria bacterium]|nr:MMPL family transporter [Deltaproteobacteria bacterium]
MAAWARWLRYPLAVLAANLLMTAALGLFAARIEIESSLESVLPAGDPEIAYYAGVRAAFGSDDVAVVGLLAPDIFASATLAKIASLTEAIAGIEGVERVLSLTNAVDPAADVFDPPRLLPRLPPSAAAIAALKHKLASTPLYGKNLVSGDFRGAAINVFFKNLTDAQYLSLGVDQKIRGLLAAAGGPERMYYTGAAHVKQAAVELMRRDLLRFTPVALVLVLLVLWLSFWTIRGVLLPAVSVLLALVWTLGFMVLAGKAITLGTFILPPLLIVVGSSFGIHMMARYYEQVEAGAERELLVVRAFERVWLPLVVSALTMVIGFGSLAVNRITAIWDLGIFAVVGVVCLTVTSLTVIPALLQLLPAERRTQPRRISLWLAASLTRLGQGAFVSRRVILWGAAAAALVAGLGIRSIRVDSDFLYYFDPASEVRQANETINREVVGSNPFYLVIEGSGAGALKRWEVLKLIKDLQTFLATLPGVSSSLSVADYLELLDAGLSKSAEGDILLDEQGRIVAAAPAASLWEEPARLPAVLSLVSTSPATFSSVVTPDFRRANVLVRTELSGSRRIADTLAAVRAYVAEHFPAEVQVHPTGNLVLLTGSTADIVAGQIKSLSLALAVIFVVMALMFLSVKVGLLAMLPNVLPIAIFFGVMGWLGILLNLGTSLIAAIALGIAVDSTIHYMARLNLELRGETDQAAVLVRTLRLVGEPIIFTTVALFFGFLTFAGSSFVPIQNFGMLAGVTMAAALGTNLVLLPALLATTKIITLWDLLAVKLGQEPTRTIPLFAGLRPGQARVVVLMGRLQHFAPGDYVMRQGERGDVMYVVLQGVAQVVASGGGERRLIRECGRGEVIGEMGLVRHGQRSADVVAAGALDALAVDERFLQRLQGRYPRIAAQVFLNLTRILSDRLQRMTDQYVASRRA